jgi:hypothetical protein
MTTIKLRSHGEIVHVDITRQAEVVLDDDAKSALEYDIAYAAMGGRDSELSIIAQDQGPEILIDGLLTLLRVLSFDDINNSIVFMADCLDHVNAQLRLIAQCDERITENAANVSKLLRQWVNDGARLSVEDSGLEDLRIERVNIGMNCGLARSQRSMFDCLRMATDAVEQYTWGGSGPHGAFIMIGWVLHTLTSASAYTRLGDEGWNTPLLSELCWQIHHLAEAIEALQAKEAP